LPVGGAENSEKDDENRRTDSCDAKWEKMMGMRTIFFL